MTTINPIIFKQPAYTFKQGKLTYLIDLSHCGDFAFVFSTTNSNINKFPIRTIFNVNTLKNQRFIATNGSDIPVEDLEINSSFFNQTIKR